MEIQLKTDRQTKKKKDTGGKIDISRDRQTNKQQSHRNIQINTDRQK